MFLVLLGIRIIVLHLMLHHLVDVPGGSVGISCFSVQPHSGSLSATLSLSSPPPFSSSLSATPSLLSPPPFSSSSLGYKNSSLEFRMSSPPASLPGGSGPSCGGWSPWRGSWGPHPCAPYTGVSACGSWHPSSLQLPSAPLISPRSSLMNLLRTDLGPHSPAPRAPPSY